MSEDTDNVIQEIQETIQHRIDQIADTLEQAENLENLETSDNLENKEPGNDSETQTQTEIQESDNLENADTQKPDVESFEADEIYNTTTPLSNAILHRMYKIEIQNENLKEYYIHNLIISIIRDVIGHARRRLTKIRYTSLGITKQEDDIYKAKGLYKEKEFMIIQQTLQKKFPSADIKITKQKPLSENHIPVHFEISWAALELGEELEEETPNVIEKVENLEKTEKVIPVESTQTNTIPEITPSVPETSTPSIPEPIPSPPVSLPILSEKEQKKRETELNKKMDADYAIQKYLSRKRHG